VTSSESWKKLKSTNFTTASFDATLGRGQKTRPVATADIGLIEMLVNGVAPGAPVPDALIFRFFGVTNNNNPLFRAYGWAFEDDNQCWEPVLLAQLSLTFGNVQGLAGCAVAAADFDVDTISLTYGDASDVAFLSNAADLRGCYFRLETMGFPLVTTHFSMNSSATSANALYKKMSTK
jgi:hypothetical protein